MTNLPPNAVVDNTMQNHENKRGRMNPTPVAWMNPLNEVVVSKAKKTQIGCGAGYERFNVPLFTESQLRQARADALREAADVLDESDGNETSWDYLHRRAAEIEGEKK